MKLIKKLKLFQSNAHSANLQIENKQKSRTKLSMYPIYITVLQSATKVDIDFGQYILMLDLVHRSYKVLVDISWQILRGELLL